MQPIIGEITFSRHLKRLIKVKTEVKFEVCDELSDGQSNATSIRKSTVMKVPITEFVPVFSRKNLVIDLDKMLIDIIECKIYDSVLIDSRTKKIIESSCKIEKVNICYTDFIVVVRKGAKEFL